MTEKRKFEIEAAVTADTSGLEQIGQAAADMASAVQEAGQEATKGLDAIGDAAAPATQKLDAATTRMAQSIQRATAALQAGAKGSADFYEALAASRGIDTAPLQGYISELRRVEEAQRAAKQAAADSARVDPFAQQHESAKLLVRDAEYVRFWTQALTEKDAAEQQHAATVLFERQHEAAKQLARDAEYVGFWTQALAEKDRAEQQHTAAALFERQHQSAKQLVQDSEYVRFWTQALHEKDVAERQQATQSAFITSLKQQADAVGKTRSEILALQAAELGLAGQAAPYIAQLRALEQGQTAVGTSAKQTAFAMRTIPAQLQDIAVSIQGGQNPLTVLSQQGSQLATVFGGVGPAIRGVGAYVLGLVNPFTVGIAAAAALTFAFVQGAKEQEAYQKALILTGNAAGVTASQLADMARALGSGKFTQSEAAGALAEIVKTAGVAGDQLQRFAGIALDVERATGQSISKTAAQFKELEDAPLTASVKLNAEIHHLTDSLYLQIKALDDQGRHTEAARLATDAFADTMATRSKQIIENNGFLVTSWNAVSLAVRKAGSAIMDLGRDTTGSEQLAALKSQLARLEHSGTTLQDPQAVAAFDAARKTLTDRIALIETLNKRQAEGAEQQAKQNQLVQQHAQFDKEGLEFATNREKREREITRTTIEGQALVKAGLITEEQLRTRIANITEKFKDQKAPKTPSAPKGPKIGADAFQTEALKEYVAALESFQRIAGSAAAKADDLSKSQEELRKIEASPVWATYSRQQQEQVIYAASLSQAEEDRAAAAKKTEEATKAFNQAVAAGNADTTKQTVAMEEAAAAAELQLQGFGLLKSQIQELTLARLEDERAAGDASQKDLDELDRRIQAQRRLIDATKGIESKELAKKGADDALREWERAADSINQSLTDALLRGFESGKDFAKNFGDTVKNLFATLILKPVIQATLSPVSGALTGIGQQIGGSIIGGGGSAAAGGSSLLNTAGSLGSLAGLGSIGTAFTAGSTSVGVMAGSVAGGGGLLGGAASALGAIGPVGWVALAALAAYAIFSGKGGGPKTEAGAGVGVRTVGDFSGIATSMQAIQTNFSDIATAIGGAAGKLDLGIFSAADPQGKAQTQLDFKGFLNGQSIYDRGARLGGIENVGRSPEELQAAMAAEAQRVTLQALQASHFTNSIGEYLQQLGDINALSDGAVAESLAKVQNAATQRAALQDRYYQLTDTALDASARARDKERAAIDSTNLALYDQLTAIAQTSDALAAAKTASESAKQQLVQAYDAEKAAREQEIASAKQSVQVHRDLAASLRDSSRALLQSDAFSDPQRTASSLAALQIAAAQASAGDQGAAQKLSGAGTDYLSNLSNTAASSDEYRAGVALVRRILEAAGSGQDMQGDIAQQQLDAQQAQLDAATRQLTQLGVLDDTVTSVGAAVSSYLDAISTQVSLAADLQREQLLWQKVLAGGSATTASLPLSGSFAKGTDYVPGDMVAQIHQGERIVPRNFNPAAGGSDPAYQALVEQFSALNDRVDRVVAVLESTADHTYKTKLATEEMRDRGVPVFNSPSGLVLKVTS